MKELVKKGSFCYDMDRAMDKIGNGYILCVLGNLNGWIGDKVRADITGAFGVSGENEKGEDWWSSMLKGDCVWITYTLNTRICISKQGWQGAKIRVKVKSMIDLVLVKKDMLHFVQDVRAVRGMRQGISDHYIVLCKIKVVWISKA